MSEFFIVGYRTQFDAKFRRWGGSYTSYQLAVEHVERWMRWHPEKEFEFQFYGVQPKTRLRFVPPITLPARQVWSDPVFQGPLDGKLAL